MKKKVKNKMYPVVLLVGRDFKKGSMVWLETPSKNTAALEECAFLERIINQNLP